MSQQCAAQVYSSFLIVQFLLGLCVYFSDHCFCINRYPQYPAYLPGNDLRLVIPSFSILLDEEVPESALQLPTGGFVPLHRLQRICRKNGHTPAFDDILTDTGILKELSRRRKY